MPNLKENNITRFNFIIIFIFLLFGVLFSASLAYANNLPDRDKDGVPDEDEINVYYTNPDNPDTDGDDYSDRIELINGYSPHTAGKIKLEDNDFDKDGLTDRQELRFKTNMTKADTDGDGYNDGNEIKNGYNPFLGNGEKLEKNIKINLGRQELSYRLGDINLGTYKISSGLNGTTPKGEFRIRNKSPKAWSSYGLWMPYWLGIEGQRFGIHELPIWPNGYREGADHLGRPVSHGCIRLGIGPAKILYDWVEIGTKVIIY